MYQNRGGARSVLEGCDITCTKQKHMVCAFVAAVDWITAWFATAYKSIWIGMDIDRLVVDENQSLARVRDMLTGRRAALRDTRA
jgi:hypothetical protein